MRRLLALTFAAALVVLTSASAQADSKNFGDPVGDAPASGDITGGTFTIDDAAVTWVLDVRDVRSTGRFRVKLIVDNDFDNPTYYADIVRSGGKVTAKTFKKGSYEGPFLYKVTCPEKQIGWDQAGDQVTLVIPRQCLTIEGFADHRMAAVGFVGSTKDTTVTRPIKVDDVS